MRRLINRLLIWLGLRKHTVGWKFTSTYARVSDDWIVRGEIVEDKQV